MRKTFYTWGSVSPISTQRFINRFKGVFVTAFLLVASTVQGQTWAGSTSQTGNAYRSGNVGFGNITGPLTPIHVGVSCGVPAGVRIDCYAPYITPTCQSNGQVSPDPMIINTMPTFLTLKTEFIVKANGFTGIGIAAPTAKLDVQGNSGTNILNLRNSAGDLKLVVQASGDLTTSAKVGIGYIASTAQLEVLGASGADIVNFRNSSGTTVFKANNTGVQITGIAQIGNTTTPAGYKLYVETGILTEKVKVAVKNTGNWSDFVFDKSYKLKTLSEVEAYINENKHLPDIPSADEVVKEGLDLAKMDAKLLQKVEELTLYIIAQEKRIKDLETVISNRKK